MTRIIVQPEHLRSLAAQCRRQVDDLRSILGNLSAGLGGLDWQVRESAGVDGRWQVARGRGYGLAEQAEALARYLDRKAGAFDEADNTGAAAVGQVAGAFTVAQQQWSGWWQQIQPALSFPHDWLIQLARLGQGIVNAPLIWAVTALGSVSAVVGGLLVGTQSLRSPVPTPAGGANTSTATSAAVPGALYRLMMDKMQRPALSSSPSQSPVTEPTIRLSDGRQVLAPQLDGRTPAEGLDSIYGKPGQFLLKAPITSTADMRRPELYAAAINQFGVEGNPRYTRDGSYTYCNTFAGDVARAMGVPLPTKAEWLGIKGDPATVAAADLHRWFTTRSSTQGWREVDPSTPDGLRLLQEHVNIGRPAMAVAPGHIAVVRPNPQAETMADLHVAQAGKYNLNDVRLGDAGLGASFNPRFFVHD